MGILIVPAIFVWFLLWRGYPASTREAAFIYMAVSVALGVLVAGASA